MQEKIVLVTIAVAVKLTGKYEIPDTLVKTKVDNNLKEWSDGRYPFDTEMAMLGVQGIVSAGIRQAAACYAYNTWPPVDSNDDSKELREACEDSEPEYIRVTNDLCTVSMCDDTPENREKISQTF